MAVNLSPVGGVAAQFFTNTGAVLTGGKLYTYAAGTTTPAVTYTSSSGATPWTNPIVLDAAGRVPSSGEIWLTDGIVYKFVLKDSNDVLIATYDGITGINSNAVAYTNQQEIVTATAGQTVFDLSISYQPATYSLSVFVDGVNQYGPGAQYAYVETDSNTVTFVSGLHVGAEVKFTTTQQQGAGIANASQITYDPAGTGAVATNVQDKLRQTVSVMDFGAVGDGVTDDTVAIQAAIDAVYARGGGGVFVPGGKYKITSSITIKAAVTLFADTSQAERLSAAGKASALFRCYGTGYDAIQLGTTPNNALGAGIIGISIFYAPQAGIVAYSHGMLIDSCAVTFAAGTGIKLVSGSGPTLIQNTHIISPGMHGIEVATADCRIENSEVQQPNNAAAGLPANTYDCISMTATAGPLQIVDCRMGDDAYRNRHGIYIAGGSLQITCTDLQNNTISGIHIAGGNSHNICGNKIASASTNANKAGISLNSSGIVNITGNILNGISAGGLGGVVLNGTCSNLNIQSNTFFGNWKDDSAITFPTAGDRLLITFSSIQGSQGYSLYSYNRSETVAGATPVIHPAGYNEVLVNVVNATATTMTSMTGGSFGQRMTLYFGDANTTVQHGISSNNFRLNGGANVTPTARSTMTFIYTFENKFHINPLWIEVGRTIY